MSAAYVGSGFIFARTRCHHKVLITDEKNDSQKYNILRKNYAGEKAFIYGVLVDTDQLITIRDLETCINYLISKLRPTDEDRLNIYVRPNLLKCPMTREEIFGLGAAALYMLASSNLDVKHELILSNLEE